MFQKEIVPKVVINDSEIEKVIDKKQTEYQIRWIYSDDNATIANYYKQIVKGSSFDSLFNIQLNDSVLIDDRQLNKQFIQYLFKKSQSSLRLSIHLNPELPQIQFILMMDGT